jgi:hypothetical protein
MSRPRWSATVFGSEVPSLLYAGVAGHELIHQVQARHLGRLGIASRGHLAPDPIDPDAAVELQIRWASSGGTRSSMYFSSSLRRCSASRGWVRDSGGRDLPGQLWAASSAGGGCPPLGPPVAAPAPAGTRRAATVITPPRFWSVRALSSQAVVAALDVAAMRPAPYCRPFLLTSAGCICLLPGTCQLSGSLE